MWSIKRSVEVYPGRNNGYGYPTWRRSIPWGNDLDYRLFATTFGLIFIAELPDKTAFATLLLAARNNPVAVFVGVAFAFVIQTIFAIAFGSLLTALPARWTHLGAGLLFLLFAYLMWRERGEPAGEEIAKGIVPLSFGRTVLSSFLVIFVAEWGDLTQLATAALQAKYNAAWTIFTASVLALWSVTLISVSIGHYLRHVLRPRLLQTVGAIVFAAAGVFFLVCDFK